MTISISQKHGYTPREVRRFAILYGDALPNMKFQDQPDLKFDLPPQPVVAAALAEGLTAEALRPVEKLMQELDNGTQPSPYCYEALRASYRAARLLNNALRFKETGRGSTFLMSLHRNIAIDHALSPLQIDCLNENLKKFDRKIMPKIQGDSFRKARPDWFEPF